MNSATQELTIDAKGREKVRRWAVCPVHNQRSSNYVGVSTEGWLFRCSENTGHYAHDFKARPPKNAPTSWAEVQAWMNAQRQARLVKMSKRGA